MEKIKTNGDKTIIFGIHFTLDGYGGNPKKLFDLSLIFHLLNDLPPKLGMTKMTLPYVVYWPGKQKKDSGGISGFVMIAESHISIHTFWRRGFATIDVYTCDNQLDTKCITSYFKDALGLKKIETHLIKRGPNYPAANTV